MTAEERYRLHVDWPDGTPSRDVVCTSYELARNLEMVPHWIGQHPPFAAPIMIEIHTTE